MRTLSLCLYLSLLFAAGCTTVISEQSRKLVDSTAPFKEIKEAPENYIGKHVLLGGRIARTRNSSDGARIEIVQFELTSNSYPEDTFLSYGRFLATSSSYMDPLIFKQGMLLTLVGEIKGKMTMRLDDMDYTYPVIAMREWYLWPGSGSDRVGSYPEPLPQYDPYNFGFGYEPFLQRPYNYSPVPR